MIRARLIDDPELWQRDRVRLIVWDDVGFDQRRYLMADGTWSVSEDPTAAKPGWVVPREAIEGLAQAIQSWQGHAGHADTEARVLREWLEVERGRVDQTLERALE